jgi:hypothetical protein
MNCSNCFFWKDNKFRSEGICRRYPTFLTKFNEEWCGEYKPIATEVKDKPKAEVKPVMKKRGRPKTK